MGRDARIWIMGFACGALTVAIGHAILFETPGTADSDPRAGAEIANVAADGPTNLRPGAAPPPIPGRLSNDPVTAAAGDTQRALATTTHSRVPGEGEPAADATFRLIDRHVVSSRAGTPPIYAGAGPPATLVCTYRNAAGVAFEMRTEFDSESPMVPTCSTQRPAPGR